MTIATACKTAALRLTGTPPGVIFGNQDKFAQELADLANEAAVDIARSHDWTALHVLHTLVGDGTTTSFALPADFDRLPLRPKLKASWYADCLPRLASADDLLEDGPRHHWGWLLLGKTLTFAKPLPNGASVKFFYISNALFDGKAKAAADTDVFALNEDTLALAIIWRWRAQKRLEYSEDMQNAEIAKSRDIANDGGRRILAIGGGGTFRNVQTAFNGVLSP